MYYYSMENNNKLFSYNNKVYKTEAAMKKAKTMGAIRASKHVKKKLMSFLRRNKTGKLQLIIKKIIKKN